MLKSVFAKYITAFMLIILCSFLIIALIISAIVGNYSEDAKSEMMDNAAHSSAQYLEDKLDGRGLSALVEEQGENITAVLSIICRNSDDLTVLLSDSEGQILLAVGEDKDEIGTDETIPPELMDEVNSDKEISNDSQIYDVFSSPRYIYAVPVHHEGSVCGTVFVCSSSVMLTELLEVIIKAIIVSIFWVMLAALLAVYIVTERVISPLKEISLAAKSFAAGKFDVRVPVRGRDEVAELAVAINNMAESLDNYENMRNTFISNVSHDLRTPMTSISGFIDGIVDGVIPPEKHEYYLRIVSSEVKRLSRLVTTLLDLSRIQAGDRKFSMTTFDICEMGRQILISFEGRLVEKGLDVEFDADEDSMLVCADMDAVYQVFYNLCDNGVKFASDGGKFRISIRKQKGKKVVVSVFNEGQGISDTDLPYVFERFYKSDKSRGINKTGVGLGLYISKTIVDAHGEKIWVESEYGSYCCFNFTLTQE